MSTLQKKLVLKHDTLAGRACTCVPNVIINCKGNTASRVKQHLLITKNVQQPRKVSFNFSKQNLFVLCFLISLFACLFCSLWSIFFFLWCWFLLTGSELPAKPSLSGNFSSSLETAKDEFLHTTGQTFKDKIRKLQEALQNHRLRKGKTPVYKPADFLKFSFNAGAAIKYF